MLWPQGKGEVEIQTSNLCFMRQSLANCATPWGLYKNYILNIGITKSTTECISLVPRIQDHSNNYLKNIDFSSITRYPFHLACNCNTTSILPIVSIKGNIPSKQSTTFNKLFFHPNYSSTQTIMPLMPWATRATMAGTKGRDPTRVS